MSQMSIAPYQVKADTCIKLSQIEWTKVQRAGIQFVHVIGPIHDAAEVNAVVNAEHMRSFMCQDFTTAT